ncbi:hypothetical protein [Nostoc sp. 'Peltigera membranacea cyanobiont' 232]|uniref:hypothetical protein n=1 Tax=Nostoc sp. 'Peltigera membranacea cyanobiont' 232 TaxID=2014531 RepID=UPI001677832E|nr:hypothetical protein [Nostoc sp. 'Peltigera membranacea cyanobiont' 232]
MQKLRFLPSIITALTALTLTSCSTTTAEQYEATALTSYTWLVLYANNLTNQPQPRIETFANTSVVNRNGVKPPGAVVGPDDRGLWWPTLPPRPSVDEVEQRKKSQEEAGKPELMKDVQYKLTKFKSEVGSRKSEVKNGLMPPNSNAKKPIKNFALKRTLRDKKRPRSIS